MKRRRCRHEVLRSAQHEAKRSLSCRQAHFISRRQLHVRSTLHVPVRERFIHKKEQLQRTAVKGLPLKTRGFSTPLSFKGTPFRHNRPFVFLYRIFNRLPRLLCVFLCGVDGRNQHTTNTCTSRVKAFIGLLINIVCFKQQLKPIACFVGFFERNL